MTVWYLDNEDCSGIFSTREKAIESLRNCAKRCGWVELSHRSYSWGDEFHWAWCADDIYEDWQISSTTILAFTLDEDNGV